MAHGGEHAALCFAMPGQAMLCYAMQHNVLRPSHRSTAPLQCISPRPAHPQAPGPPQGPPCSAPAVLLGTRWRQCCATRQARHWGHPE